ncbi:EndoU domain-containing protein [Neisseria sp. Ec49-e6-T10]|uniref:EndoU domain-containing protein n=1 Tax=Neisseria sp. Ec49-e6-T10 TaxID=3140744 RepID=UPI003EB71B2C
MEQSIESIRQSNIDTYGLAGTALLFGSAEVLSEFVPIKGGKQLSRLLKLGGDETVSAITKNMIKVGDISNVKYFEHDGVSFSIKGYTPQSGYAKQPQLKISAIELKFDDMLLQKGSTGKIEVEKHRGLNSVITPEMEEKILWGQRKNPNRNDIIGGHISKINNTHPNYAVEDIVVNADGTKKIKYTTQFPDGDLARIKNSTVFPESWSDTKIIDSIKQVGSGTEIGYRARDGAKLYRQVIDGVEIEVIKIRNNVVSGYPTGGNVQGISDGFIRK